MLYFIFYYFFNCILHFLCSSSKRKTFYHHPTSVGCCVAAEGGERGRSGSIGGRIAAVMVADPRHEAGRSDHSSPNILAPTASSATPMVSLLHLLPIRKLLCVLCRLLPIPLVNCSVKLFFKFCIIVLPPGRWWGHSSPPFPPSSHLTCQSKRLSGGWSW